jgi:Alpha 1,4-glycosyltransferase conserved region
MRFGAFWYGGRLSAFEFCCLQSFVRNKHEITLFSYDKIENAPAGVKLCNANKIVKEEYTKRFLLGGKPSLTPFSNYFRYKMFLATDLVWVDADMFMLNSFAIRDDENLFALEDDDSICNAILRIARSEPLLPELIRRTELLMDKNLVWGQCGPKLVTEIFKDGSAGRELHPPHEFFPIHHFDFWKVFLPEHFDECAQACQNAKTIHLWNNIINRIGFWKNLLPPEGSYLYSLLKEVGPGAGFVGICPDYLVRNMTDNWRARWTGEDLRLKPLMKQFVPSIRKTLKYHFDKER